MPSARASSQDRRGEPALRGAVLGPETALPVSGNLVVWGKSQMIALPASLLHQMQANAWLCLLHEGNFIGAGCPPRSALSTASDHPSINGLV